jgi:hypothetical protein
MGNPIRILMMAMAVASGNAFIVSPKAQLAARRTLPHARAMPIVAAYSKFEDEAKYTEAEPTVNPLVAFDKNWLTPLLPLIIGYGFIEINEGRPGFCFYAMLPLNIVHGLIVWRC